VILKIRKWPDPMLRTRCLAVSVFDDDLERLARDMIETMRAEGGIGLSANQVGDSRRVAVTEVPRLLGDMSEPYHNIPIVLVNPILLEAEVDVMSREGCLSLPDVIDVVKRFDQVTVRYQNLSGEHKEIRATGLMAACLQHEIDHLDGKTLVEKASRIKKDMIMRRLKKTRNA
jgi:peptide deformylase